MCVIPDILNIWDEFGCVEIIKVTLQPMFLDQSIQLPETECHSQYENNQPVVPTTSYESCYC